MMLVFQRITCLQDVLPTNGLRAIRDLTCLQFEFVLDVIWRKTLFSTT